MTFSFKNRFYNLLRLFKCLSPLRAFNYAMILISYSLSRLFRSAVVFSYPFSLTFEVSSECNLRCPQCLSGRGEISRIKPFIEVSFVEKMLRIFRKRAFYVNFYMQGEPLLNKDLPIMIKKAKELSYYTYVSTNGTLLSEKAAVQLVVAGLDRLVVSVDGMTQETYSFYRRGGRLTDVVKGVKNLVVARKKLKKNNPVLIMQFLVNKKNEHELPELKKFAKASGFDMLQLKSMQIYDDDAAYIPNNKQFNRSLYKQKKRGCFRLWSHAVFTSDESLIPCCYDKKPGCEIKISQPDKKSIWYNSSLQRIREKANSNRSSLVICRDCHE